MTMHNNVGITSYSRKFDRGIEGAPASLEALVAEAYANPILPQIGTVTIGGTKSDGNFVTTILDDATGVSVSVTTVRDTTPDSNDDIAAQHAADINAAAGLNGVVEATVASAVITLTFQHPGRTYTVTTSETTATSTITWAQTQAAGGSVQYLARFHAEGTYNGGRVAAALTGSSVVDDVVGFSVRPLGEIQNDGSGLASALDSHAAGDMFSSAIEGRLFAKNVGGGTANPNGEVFIVISTAGGDSIGQVRSAAAGVQQVLDVSPTEVNATRYQIQVSLIDDADGRTVSVANAEFLSDGSATETEITSALKVDLDTLPIVTTYSLATGTDGASDDISLTLTAPLGYTVVCDGIGDGTVVVTETTAGVNYTLKMPKGKAKWVDSVANDAIGPIEVNL